MAMTTHSATEKDSMVRYIGLVIGLLIVLPTVARAQTETVVYFHTDAVGSVRMTTDASGQVIQRYDYAPFGEPLPAPTPETRRFAGGELDPETELNYFGARQYQPQTGRFTRTDDPGYGNPFDPQSMNFYAYVMNNPLRWVDPSGHHHNGGCHGIADYPHPVCPGVDVDVRPDPQLPYFPFFPPFPPHFPGGGGERSGPTIREAQLNGFIEGFKATVMAPFTPGPPSCLAIVFQSIAQELNPASPGLGEAAGVSVGYSYAASKYNEALQYAASRSSRRFGTPFLGDVPPAVEIQRRLS